MGHGKFTVDFAGANELRQMAVKSPLAMKAATKAGADLLKEYAKNSAQRMLHGNYWTGTTMDAIVSKQTFNTYAFVTYEGTRVNRWLNPPRNRNTDWASLKNNRHQSSRAISSKKKRKYGKGTKRNGEVAFIQEYGAYGRAARPFNQDAVDRGRSPVENEVEKVFWGMVGV